MELARAGLARVYSDLDDEFSIEDEISQRLIFEIQVKVFIESHVLKVS